MQPNHSACREDAKKCLSYLFSVSLAPPIASHPQRKQQQAKNPACHRPGDSQLAVLHAGHLYCPIYALIVYHPVMRVRFSIRWLLVITALMAIASGTVVRPTVLARRLVAEINNADFR